MGEETSTYDWMFKGTHCHSIELTNLPIVVHFQSDRGIEYRSSIIGGSSTYSIPFFIHLDLRTIYIESMMLLQIQGARRLSTLSLAPVDIRLSLGGCN